MTVRPTLYTVPAPVNTLQPYTTETLTTDRRCNDTLNSSSLTVTSPPDLA